MAKIEKVKAREILDSRGNPTIETTVWLSGGISELASVPSGASTGKYEAHELRDNDLTRFGGQGVLKAIANINDIIAPKVIGMEASEQTKLDQLLINLDGTTNKQKLGGNSILSVSTAVLKASAASYKLPIYQYLHKKYGQGKKEILMPTPTFNVINGGKHGAGNNLDFQEFHVVPSKRFVFHESLRMGDEVYKKLGKTLAGRNISHSVGDEGGYAPNLFTNLDALEVIVETIKQTNYQLSKDIFLGLDVAASNFHQNGRYPIKDRAQPFNTDELIAYYQELNTQYRLFSLEDPLDEDDWDGWQKLTQALREDTLIVGDDLLTTNGERVKMAVSKNACNAILIKPNQIGTISETIQVINACRQQGWKVIVSHRSGETNDTFIADFAVGIGADYTKFGAPSRGERVVKYNRLLAIESELQPA
jgi:enolase